MADMEESRQAFAAFRLRKPTGFLYGGRVRNKEEQIVGTREKSQQIVAQRLLSCLQYPDATKSSAKDLSQPPCNL